MPNVIILSSLTHIRNIFLNFKLKMSSSNSLLVPVGVRGMKHLDREKFSRNIAVPVLKVTDEIVSKVLPVCKKYYLKLENFKLIQKFDDPIYSKCIHLNPDKISNWLDISEEDRTALKEHSVDETFFDTKDCQLTYENYTFDVIFKAVLPENEEIVSGFSQIGHIVHLNLREHLLEYRSLIGQVLLDKIKTCRTVVNKSNIIDNTYRNFAMEVIAGEKNFMVTVKENQCNFQFDFSKVYWNSRLCREHERILEFLKPGDVLFDVFCGVGPFAIPAAKKNCKVYANDLNPESFKALKFNVEKNKVKKDLFKAYNMDGKDFICDVFKEYLLEYCMGKHCLNGAKIHITMNLPAMAVEFLKYYKGLLKSDVKDKLDCEIIVYVYCFAIGDDPYSTAKQMAIENIGVDIKDNIIDVFNVRTVSPNKVMMRVTFKLTKDIIFHENHELEEPPSKKKCL